MFSLWPDRMSGSGLNLPFHEIKAKTNKNWTAKQINLSSACFSAKPTCFAELCVPECHSYNEACIMIALNCRCYVMSKQCHVPDNIMATQDMVRNSVKVCVKTYISSLGNNISNTTQITWCCMNSKGGGQLRNVTLWRAAELPHNKHKMWPIN